MRNVLRFDDINIWAENIKNRNELKSNMGLGRLALQNVLYRWMLITRWEISFDKTKGVVTGFFLTCKHL